MTWHHDFPDEAREMWDVLAKALMLRAGGTVTITQTEQRLAADTQAEIMLHDDGSISLRVERQ